ncbi:hypothetical protein Pmani_032667 [Petrolisthes manimaculis]|uniref:CUB domain-containing protein n=1 Tax=Petrolisthes manimaculis TaxID=1843537 RepID=A0AAE1NR90_9EUCA|nr:hypothetical protein Pmani_032667 [Petrolisthes manimaculis]
MFQRVHHLSVLLPLLLLLFCTPNTIAAVPHRNPVATNSSDNGVGVAEGGGVVETRPYHHHHHHLQHFPSQWQNGTIDSTGIDNSLTEKDGKFLFTVVQFPNILCGSGINSGTCFTRTECLVKGGTIIDSCALGYGVCCQVKVTSCGGDITVNNTIVTNAEYDNTFNEGRNCVFKVQFDDTTNEICQIRYEFIDFDFVAPETTGVCSTDKLVFEDDRKSQYFCGKAPANYHWYVETAGTTSPQSFSISTDGTTSYNRKYAIRVTTIPCMQEVPTYCGQYYDGTSGQISSFNYGNGAYLAGLMYSICFQKEDGYCTYTLKKTSDNQFIGAPDMLRLPMGEGIAVEANPAAAGSAIICAIAIIQITAMYSTIPQCFYPSTMTSNNREAAFYVTINTLVDGNDNRNPVDTTAAGFQFDWETNTC